MTSLKLLGAMTERFDHWWFVLLPVWAKVIHALVDAFTPPPPPEPTRVIVIDKDTGKEAGSYEMDPNDGD